MVTSPLPIIGSNASVTVGGIKNIPAKVDTGADSSSIWASDIIINSQKEVEFSLFAPGSPLYTGKRLSSHEFTVKRVRSSNGAVSIRYVVPLVISVSGHRIRAQFTLADRSRNRFPVLIGRRTLNGKFLVDVSRSAFSHTPTFDNADLNAELSADPQKFHQKHMK